MWSEVVALWCLLVFFLFVVFGMITFRFGPEISRHREAKSNHKALPRYFEKPPSLLQHIFNTSTWSDYFTCAVLFIVLLALGLDTIQATIEAFGS